MSVEPLEVGATIPAGTLVLLTAGDYSSFHVIGLFRSITDVVVPGIPRYSSRPDDLIPDTAKLSTLMEEVPYVEVWHDV